jgi:alcohol oxidase
MKPREMNEVVDKHLNVYGTENLKSRVFQLHLLFIILDMSICPRNLGGNTCTAALVIGEKAAVIIAKQLGLTI